MDKKIHTVIIKDPDIEKTEKSPFMFLFDN